MTTAQRRLPSRLTAGAGFFALNVQRLVRYLRIGLAENRTNDPAVRVKNVLSIGIAQSKIFRDPIAGPMHAAIFWGFVVLTAGSIEILLQGVFNGFSYDAILPEPVYRVYALSQTVRRARARRDYRDREHRAGSLIRRGPSARTRART